MTEAEVRVLEAEPGYAWVEPKPHSPCGQCDPAQGCRSVSIARLFGGKSRFRVRDPLGCAPGERVFVAVPDGGVLGSALLMYLLPLGALFAGALAGAWAGELTSVLSAVLALLASLLWVRRRARALAADPRFQPHISRRFDPSLQVMEISRSCRSKS